MKKQQIDRINEENVKMMNRLANSDSSVPKVKLDQHYEQIKKYQRNLQGGKVHAIEKIIGLH